MYLWRNYNFSSVLFTSTHSFNFISSSLLKTPSLFNILQYYLLLYSFNFHFCSLYPPPSSENSFFVLGTGNLPGYTEINGRFLKAENRAAARTKQDLVHSNHARVTLSSGGDWAKKSWWMREQKKSWKRRIWCIYKKRNDRCFYIQGWAERD